MRSINFRAATWSSISSHVVGGSPQLYLRLNLYANHRFPHNPMFVRNLLVPIRSLVRATSSAWEALLRQHWFEEVGLRNEFFEFLSSEHGSSRNSMPYRKARRMPPVGEESCGCRFPRLRQPVALAFRGRRAHAEIVRNAISCRGPDRQHASSVYRSLAYYEPADTAVAARSKTIS